MHSIYVGLKNRSYRIIVARGAFQNAGRWIKAQGLEQRTALVVSQKEIMVYYADAISQSLQKEGFETSFFVTPFSKSSEAAKSEAVYSKLIKKIASCDGSQKSIFLIALGGGVIGDLTGFAASVYRRGIPYIQIPTTLTAQVDSAIGGKTGIDLPQGKNLLGSIYQPKLVLSDPELLASLPERHWSDGFAEVIKYGVIAQPALFYNLEKNGKEGCKKNAKVLEKIIFLCAKIKAKIVKKDEWDQKDLRIILNFGHTVGHAIEAAGRFSKTYTHGEAVAIGMLAACDVAQALGVLKDKSLTKRLEKTLIKFNLPVFYQGITVESILHAIGYDKKSRAGKNRFILPVSLGKMTTVNDVPELVIRQALEQRKS